MNKRALFQKKPSGKNYFLVLFIFLILISGILLVSSFPKNNKISDKVYKELKNKDEIAVLIMVIAKEKGLLTESMSIEDVKKDIKENLKTRDIGESSDLISVKISKKELEELGKKQGIIKIIPAPQISAFLQDSVPQINASVVWPVNLSNQNITGINETICIIDTGINFSHPDLINKNKTCIINCFGGGGCVENCSIHDDNGHGTHVAGIAAANGNIKGVAVGANLIGVKVLDSSGSGDPVHAGTDLVNAIDWCVANRIKYNISVISMSLGTSAPNLFDTYCDTNYSVWATPINNATYYNISVIIAAGNDGNITSIASPACIENATAVGSIGKDDSTFAYNRNNLIDFVSPGGTTNGSATCSPGSMDSDKICSTYSDGTYIAFAGTSMAAPHVAGAFVLFRQFFRLQNNRVPTPDEIKTVFNSTGKQINDASGSNLNYSRIDVYAALVNIDNSNPIVNLLYPKNNTIQFTQNLTFNCSANDVQLSNITLYVYNSTGNIYNNTEISGVSGVNALAEFNLTNMSYGDYTWNCLAYDENNNFSFSSNNFTLTIDQLDTTLNSPANNTFTNQNQTYNCSAQTESTKLLSNITLYIWNSTDNLVYNKTKNISGAVNSTTFNYNFTQESNYTWNCLSYNNATESYWADNNFTIDYDVSNPSIENISSSVSITSSTITWDTNESTNSSINYGTTTSLGTESTNSSLATSHSFSLTSLSASTIYYYNITNCDKSNNCVINGTNSFTTSPVTSPDTGGPSGGGGGSSVSTMTYIPSLVETTTGYTKSLAKNDKIKFTIFDGKNFEHSLTLNYVGTNSVDISINSNPIKLLLGVGQSAKLNLSSSDYYDLYVKLNSIKNNKADITMQTIHEIIPKPLEITGNAVEEMVVGEKDKEKKIPERNLRETFIYGLGLILIIIGVIVLLRKKSGNKKSKKTIAEYKEKFKEIKPKKKRTLLKKRSRKIKH